MAPPGLYVHVPFCSAICNYCNFNRGLFDYALKERFLDALLDEIRLGINPYPFPLAPDTLYFGGGTPSLLAPEEIKAIVDQARRYAGLTPNAEITLEANPETVTAPAMEQFRLAGVNRLSVGVQSFRDEELSRLGRRHSAETAIQAVERARVAGLDDVSIDLMMCLPGQTLAQWIESVQRAIEVAPDHMSLYILEVYPHLSLKQEIDRHRWSMPLDDVAADMYEEAMAMLEDAGYEQYEISNVAKPGHRSRHNLKYWSDGEWLGFGPGAHSTWQGSRWRNVSSTEEYARCIKAGEPAVVDRRRLSDEERLGDALFTGLRLSDGIDVESLSRRYDVDIWERFGDRLAPFCNGGILRKQDGRLRLTRQGMLVANEVMAVFV